MSDYSGALDTFYAESDELLSSMEDELLGFEESPDKDESMNAIFRAVHTIKGSSGIFGLSHIVGFTHVVENILDRARAGEVKLERELIDIFLACRDHISVLVHTSEQEFNELSDLIASGEELLLRLQPWSSNSNSTSTTEPSKENSGKSRKGLWHISIRLNKDCLRNGMDPISFINFLSSLGEVNYIETMVDHLPELEKFDPEDLYLAYEISLEADTDKESIQEVFMFVEEDSDITIISPDSNIDDYIGLIKSLPESDARLGQILVAAGVISEEQLLEALNNQDAVQDAYGIQSKIGEVLVGKNVVAKELVDAALEKQEGGKELSKQKETSFIRVDSERLDYLINLIGELVINRQRVDLISNEIQNGLLLEAVEGLGHFTEKIRDAALDLRMVPIGGTFQRFKRVVRDTSKELGKDIRLEISGAEAELDRIMVERLVDPLTHIVRNAIDHGIEPLEIRAEKGKAAAGTLKLSAYHEAGHIVIEVIDDGGGLDRNKLLEKARAKGIVGADEQLSANDINNLIFHPGFSTAENVTNLSGRGVGMDVVKRNVEGLQGSIEIQSEPNVGSTFRIRLPLTLAIIDGFHVESKSTHFVIPQATIVECIDFDQAESMSGRQCINLRGEMIPYLRLLDIYKLDKTRGKQQEITKERHRENLVVVQFGENTAGIIVERLHGEIQTVVKPMGQIFQNLKGIGGSTLLGNGEIAFILDIPQLIEVAVSIETRDNEFLVNNLES